ncbi:MAG: hypothetical protein F6K39_33805 [Okeania sp. SIO3B3]|nr:hypothetical protein [Okeania sp. SIO3B3]
MAAREQDAPTTVLGNNNNYNALPLKKIRHLQRQKIKLIIVLDTLILSVYSLWTFHGTPYPLLLQMSTW